GRLVEVVMVGRANGVALGGLDSGCRARAVVAERRDRLLDCVDPVVDPVDGQLEDLDGPVEPGLDRLVSGTFELPALAIEESLDDRERSRVVIDRGARSGPRRGRRSGGVRRVVVAGGG